MALRQLQSGKQNTRELLGDDPANGFKTRQAKMCRSCTVTLLAAVSGSKNGDKSQSWHIVKQLLCWGLNMIPKVRSCYCEHVQPKKLIFLYIWEHHGIIFLSNCNSVSINKSKIIKNSSARCSVKQNMSPDFLHACGEKKGIEIWLAYCNWNYIII